MGNNFNTPKEVIEGNISGGKVKGNLPLVKMILLGIMAGAFIAIGGATSNTAVHDISNVGLARTLAAAIFPVGLMMIVFCGGELFTGNCMMSMAVMDKQIKFLQMIRNLVVVYISNFIGAMIVDLLIVYSGNLDYTAGTLGAYTIKVAMGKVTIDPIKGICSGILCNILVCMAILMAGSAKDIVGKVFAIFFPIFAFVIGGFEHCVANMYYIPAGILASKQAKYADKAMELYGYTAEQMNNLSPSGMLKNLVPVTIGNIIGGAIFVGLMYYFIHIKEWNKTTEK